MTSSCWQAHAPHTTPTKQSGVNHRAAAFGRHAPAAPSCASSCAPRAACPPPGHRPARPCPAVPGPCLGCPPRASAHASRRRALGAPLDGRRRARRRAGGRGRPRPLAPHAWRPSPRAGPLCPHAGAPSPHAHPRYLDASLHPCRAQVSAHPRPGPCRGGHCRGCLQARGPACAQSRSRRGRRRRAALARRRQRRAAARPARRHPAAGCACRRRRRAGLPRVRTGSAGVRFQALAPGVVAPGTLRARRRRAPGGKEPHRRACCSRGSVPYHAEVIWGGA